MFKYRVSVSNVAIHRITPAYFLQSALLAILLPAFTGSPVHAQEKECLFSINARNKKLYDVLMDLQAQAVQKKRCGCIAAITNTPGLDKRINYKADHLPLATIMQELALQNDMISTPGLCFTLEPKTPDSAGLHKQAAGFTCQGRVLNERREPLPGASIWLKGSKRGTITDSAGHFTLHCDASHYVIIISNIGYQASEIAAWDKVSRDVILPETPDEIPVTISTGYGAAKPKLTSANIYVIDKSVFSTPTAVSFPNVLAGRSPGLLLNPLNGVSYGFMKMQVEGNTSIGLNAGPGNLPVNGLLVIFDGVPLIVNVPVTLLKSIAGDPNAAGSLIGGISSFYFINPADIENVEVLTSATATSIYGSRGANGVLLITTLKGKPGKLRVNIQASQGAGRIERQRRLLTTPEYLAMRREAFMNDGYTPNTSNAPDLVVFDTTRQTNYRDVFLGKTAITQDAHVSVSGGKENSIYRAGAWIHRETTVLPTDFYNMKGQLNANLVLNSASKRLLTTTGAIGSFFKVNSPSDDITPTTYLVPNAPRLFDTAGHMLWQYKGVDFTNPWSYLLNTYEANVFTFIASNRLSYAFPKAGITVVINSGIHHVNAHETSLFPIAAQNPSMATTGAANFATNSYNSWITEPQVEYSLSKKKFHLTAFIGSTIQEQRNKREIVNATGYTNDEQLRSRADAPNASARNASSVYKYEAFFASVNLAVKDRYVIDLVGRRDGSSRFGPRNQFANFGAIGMAWVFSPDSSHKRKSFLTSGQLKGSYGTTGNDQIGDYMYLDTWNTTTSGGYAGASTLSPTRLVNPAFAWEVTRKLNFTLDLGLINCIKFTTTWFFNRSSNQLVSYLLPSQTGFVSITGKNLPAVVQNAGFEFVLSKNRTINKSFNWKATLILTVPGNKLVSFPGLASSPYAKSLEEGSSLTVQKGFRMKNVDPQTGRYQVIDKNNDGKFTSDDYFVNGNTDPKYYGSLSVSVHYKKIQLGILLEGRKQVGVNPLYMFYNYSPPGMLNDLFFSNKMISIQNRWRKQGDIASIQKLTTSATTAEGKAIDYFRSSNWEYIDASYIRLQNIMLSYALPKAWCTQLHLIDGAVYLEAQNLFTATRYRDADPVTQNPLTLPPLVTFTGGLRVTF